MTQSLDRKLTSVAFVLNAFDMQLSLYLAKTLVERHRSKVILYTRSETERNGVARLVQRMFPADAEIRVIRLRKLDDGLREEVGDEAAVFEKARKYEAFLGEKYNELFLDHRQLSFGFVPGGTGVPYAPHVAMADYPQTVAAMNAVLDFWEGEIETNGLTLVLNAEKWVACLCREKGISFRRRVNTRFRNHNYWAIDEFFTDPFRESIFNELESWPDIPESLSYSAQVSKNRQNIRNCSYSYALRSAVWAVAKAVINPIRNGERPNHRLWDSVLMGFRPRKGLKAYQSYRNWTLKDLEDKDFVYFPLHKEPETDYIAASPEFMNQMNAIASISRDLPVGAVLALKEHIPAFGLRPDWFYRQLSFLKNVVFVDVHESSIALISKARATATIAGTAGLEAAVMGRPVIQFCRHTLNRFLPHVFTIFREDDVRDSIRAIMNNEVDLERAAADGARYLEATLQSGFDMSEFLTKSDRSYGANTENAEAAYQGLVRSLSATVDADRGWAVQR